MRPGSAWAAPGLVALALALYLPGLGVEMLRHPLEAKYALAAREMLRGGPLLVAHLFGELYPDKPPLYFWATAALGWLAGGEITEVTARLPAALAAVIAVVLVHRLGRDLFGSRAGLAGAVVLAVSPLFFWYARQGHPDQFLTAAVTLACLALWRSLTARSRRGRLAWVAAGYLAMAIGVLSKGLLGLLLPLLAAGSYLLATEPVRRLPARLGLWPGLAVFLIAVLAWFAPAVAHTGPAYLYETIVHQHVVRYARAWVHHGPWYYYLGEFTAGFFPWSLLVPGAAMLGWRARRQRPDTGPLAPHGDRAAPDGNHRSPVTAAAAPFLLPLGWFVAGFVFFSASSSKRGAYLLPIYPAAALMVGWLWDRAMSRPERSAWIGTPLLALSGAAVFLGAALLVVPRGRIPGTMADTLVPAEPWQQALSALTLLAGSAATWTAWRRGRPGLALGLLVAVQGAVLLGVTMIRAPQYEARYPVRDLARRIEAAAPERAPFPSLLDDYNYVVAFYLDRPVMPLPGPEALLAAGRDGARFALVDHRDRSVLEMPGVRVVVEGRLGPKRVVLVRLPPG